MTRPLCVAAATALALQSLPAAAQTLVPQPDMAENVASLPRVEGAGARDTNSALQALDDLHLGFLICDDGSLADASRLVEVMAEGPEFLSFQIELGGFCEGAAHPWSETQLVAFDLASGRQTDLAQYLPPKWIETGTPEFDLYDLYLASAPDLPDECLRALALTMEDRVLRFDLGLDARSKGLRVLPVGLPYVDRACVESADVDADTLERLGFDPRLVTAVRGVP